MSLAIAAISPAADAPDYSKEAAVIQDFTTKVSFSATGAREWRQKVSVRVQSEAAVRQFGVLGFLYNSDNEQMEIEYVRVKNADGSVVETPVSSVMDIATHIAAAAPTYSDLRQKQVPVKALGVGDVLEYSVRSSQRKPEVSGQFWYQQVFIEDAVVLNQSLEIDVPKDKYVQVSSPELKSETRDEGDRRVFFWKHSQLALSKPDGKKEQATTDSEPPKVQITTFKNWEEVGNWWGALASEQAKVTPAIQEKARELTAGLSTDTEKAKAIYRYVAMKFRYVSISFGAGRYRPHSAEEVMANQYGDCKDKHTLLATLLKAAGIPAWPALIGVGVKFDSSVPSPAQFNHVITVLPRDGKYVWLDTTAEVAPFGFLLQAIRDEEALVIPPGGKPALVKTPLDAPFVASEIVDVRASLAADGTLTGRFDFRLRGDGAVAMRGAFHELAPAQWQAFAQQMSYTAGYAGDVSGVEVEDIEDVDKPLHYSYDYKRKNYSDWANHRITPPTPPLGFGPGDEADKPKDSFWAGAPGESIYRASVQLPNGFSIELPKDTTSTSDFADYSARYSVKDGTLFTERKMVFKKSKVAVEQWAEYQKFYKGVRTDQGQYLSMSETGGNQKAAVSENNPEAEKLIYSAFEAAQRRDLTRARDLLARAEHLNSKQPKLWACYAFVDIAAQNSEQAVADFRKEIKEHPDEMPAYQSLATFLAHLGQSDEALAVWLSALAQKPDDETAAARAANLLLEAKRYSEIPPMLEKPIAAAPDNYSLRTLRVAALLRVGQKDQAIVEARIIAKATSDPHILNNLAYTLADTDLDNGLAQTLAENSLNITEQECAIANLNSFESSDLARVNTLVAIWDTVGWVYFKRGDFVRAEKYIDASWRLGQAADSADHLGQIYEKQAKHEAAIHMWRLALAANANQKDAKERLQNAGAPRVEPVRTGRNPRSAQPAAPVEELSKLRTFPIPELPEQSGSAEFFLLVSGHGISAARFIGGSDRLKGAVQTLQKAKYRFAFPDEGPEKIIRRGILSCSTLTAPSCQFTFLLPSTVRKDTKPD
jgi:transglutaminase-like putative cysteine protease/tetratricopeptide (TPR) repeat protein